MEILKPKIEAHGLIDVLGMGISKQVTERLLKPYIGNGSIGSGIVKGIGGGLLYGKAGRLGNMAAGGLVVDAAEDVAVAFLSRFMGGADESTGRNSNPFLA